MINAHPLLPFYCCIQRKWFFFTKKIEDHSPILVCLIVIFSSLHNAFGSVDLLHDSEFCKTVGESCFAKSYFQIDKCI